MKILVGSLILGVLVLTSPLGVLARSGCERLVLIALTPLSSLSTSCDTSSGHAPSGFACECAMPIAPAVMPGAPPPIPSARSTPPQPSQNVMLISWRIFHPPT